MSVCLTDQREALSPSAGHSQVSFKPVWRGGAGVPAAVVTAHTDGSRVNADSETASWDWFFRSLVVRWPLVSPFHGSIWLSCEEQLTRTPKERVVLRAVLRPCGAFLLHTDQSSGPD